MSASACAAKKAVAATAIERASVSILLLPRFIVGMIVNVVRAVNALSIILWYNECHVNGKVRCC